MIHYTRRAKHLSAMDP
jgi:glycerol-3-phosphate cytidylyltransferase-like family protein